MACAITKGRGIGCKTAFAGIKNVYILDYDSSHGQVVAALFSIGPSHLMPHSARRQYDPCPLKALFANSRRRDR